MCDVVRDAVIGDGEKAGVLARFVDELGNALLGLCVALLECCEVDEWRSVTGMPAYAGTAIAEVTPGTTS